MKTKVALYASLVALLVLALGGCSGDDGPAGIDGRDATVYYSEWFSPSQWSGESGDWYFAASAPDLTEDIVERGVILAYAWLGGDLYDGTTVRPLPDYAVGANWGFLVHQYGSIEFTCDAVTLPGTTSNYFRFVAIPGTIPAAKSASGAAYTVEELRRMPYREIVELFGIPEDGGGAR